MAEYKYLLKKGDYIFKNILRGGYSVLEGDKKVLLEKKMADGSYKRNYESGIDVIIKVKFGRLNGEIYREYINQLKGDEGIFEYYSIREKKYKKAVFYVSIPTGIMLNSINEEEIEEFEIELKKARDIYG